MNENLWSLVLKAALFMTIVCSVVFFMVIPFTAEWYIMIVSVALNVILCVFIRIALKINEKKNDKSLSWKGENNEKR